APQPGARPPPAPAPSSARAATPTTAPTTAPTPTAAPTSGAAVTDPVAFIQRYYSRVPTAPESPLVLLSPSAQRQSGGHDSFVRFYSGMSQVTLQDPKQVGDNTV